MERMALYLRISQNQNRRRPFSQPLVFVTVQS